MSAFASTVLAGVEHDEELEPRGSRHLVISISGLGRGPLHVIEEMVDVFVNGSYMVVSVLANDRGWQVELAVLRIEVTLASYLDVAHRINLGVVTEHSLLDFLHVLPPLLLLNVDRNEDFVYPFKESRVVVVSIFDPSRKSGKALPVDRVDSLVRLLVAKVVANLIACGGSSFGNILEGGVALDFADLLVGGASS